MDDVALGWFIQQQELEDAVNDIVEHANNGDTEFTLENNGCFSWSQSDLDYIQNEAARRLGIDVNFQ